MRVRWFQVIDELERAGVSMRSQAITAEVSLGTIYNWKTGAEPRFRNGQLLIELYMHETGREPPLELD